MGRDGDGGLGGGVREGCWGGGGGSGGGHCVGQEWFGDMGEQEAETWEHGLVEQHYFILC